MDTQCWTGYGARIIIPPGGEGAVRDLSKDLEMIGEEEPSIGIAGEEGGEAPLRYYVIVKHRMWRDAGKPWPGHRLPDCPLGRLYANVFATEHGLRLDQESFGWWFEEIGRAHV